MRIKIVMIAIMEVVTDVVQLAKFKMDIHVLLKDQLVLFLQVVEMELSRQEKNAMMETQLLVMDVVTFAKEKFVEIISFKQDNNVMMEI